MNAIAFGQPSNSGEEPEPLDQAGPAAADSLAEEQFIALYIRITGSSETQARNVYMYYPIIQAADPYRYHLE